ncbi:MAG: nucleotidyltransferase family protein [Pyrinomonadaceae bacterium]
MKRQSPFDLENRLLRIFSQIDPPRDEIGHLLTEEIDWDYIFQTAEDHRVIPLIFDRFRTLKSDRIPEDVFGRFQNRFREIAGYNFARTTQLIKLIEPLQKGGFPVLAYKGMALAALAYGEVTLRQFTDIDLLVRKRDFPAIKELLAGIDCRPVWDLSAKQEKAFLKYYYEYPFFYGDANTLVEVHWDFVESFFTFDFDTEPLWDRVSTVRLYGREIPTLSPADYLIVLCSHASKHFWGRLSWICDIDRLIVNTRIDWDEAERLASETGSFRMLLLGAYLSREILRTTLPAAIEKDIAADKKIAPLGDKFVRGLFASGKAPPRWQEMARTHLKMREKLTTKIKYSQRLFTTKLIDKLFMPMGRPR